MNEKSPVFFVILCAAIFMVSFVGYVTAATAETLQTWLLPSTTSSLSQTVSADFGTAFTYQGHLYDDIELANGLYDLRFALYDTPTDGTQIGSTLTQTVSVVDGLFMVSLDFGSGAFDGTARYLEIAVRPSGSTDPFETLSPRQEVTPAPHATYAITAGTVAWGGLTDVPPGFADNVDNDSGGDITEVTAGEGLSGGGASGPITLTVAFSGTGAATTAAHSDHTHTIPTYDVFKVFEPDHTFPTVGAHDWEAFMIGDQYYLAVANYRNGSNYTLNSTIFHWDGVQFQEIQSIPTNGAKDWESFTIDGETYLALANRRNNTSHEVDSKIYRWNGSSFIEFQSIPTLAASDWEFFTINNTPYLVVANERSDTSQNVNSKVYRWNGVNFVEYESIPTSTAIVWESFTLNGDTYLAVANNYDGVTYNVNSKIYRWNGSNFEEVQTIPTHGATDWAFFTIGDDAYLAVTNTNEDAVLYNVVSTIYRWNGTSFIEFQSFLTHNAFDWEFFTIGENVYLAVANAFDGNTYLVNSKVYEWDGTRFVLEQAIPTIGAVDWEFFSMDGISYLAVANVRDGADFSVDSIIYQAVLSSREGDLVIGTP